MHGPRSAQARGKLPLPLNGEAKASVEDVPERLDPTLLPRMPAPIVLVAAVLGRPALVFVELGAGSGDELLELAAVQPYAATGLADIDRDAFAVAFVEQRGLTARAVHGRPPGFEAAWAELPGAGFHSALPQDLRARQWPPQGMRERRRSGGKRARLTLA